VEAQQSNPSSLFWWMKRILGVRQRWTALGRGSLRFLQPDNRKILVFLREYDGQRVLVVANLSRHAQAVELNLAEFKGHVPVEIFGSTRFPVIGEDGYRLTINPHAFFWFALQPEDPDTRGAVTLPQRLADLPVSPRDGTGKRCWHGPARRAFEQVLSGYVPQRRWFGGKARDVRAVEILDHVKVPTTDGNAQVAGPAGGIRSGGS
jgi:maltose alpha-D-glucosyltransferase/alpha-amylase